MNRITTLLSSQFFLTALCVSVFCLFPGCVTAPISPYISKAQITKNHALKTGPFWWGTSTSSFQNEDRGVQPKDPMYFLTDWDMFIEEGKAPKRGENASFSWSAFDQDVAALKEMGVNHFRYSIEWARVEPRKGVYNAHAIAQYVDMAKKLRAAGIEPIVTLWHFTFPSWLYDSRNKRHANFLNPAEHAAWQAYVRTMVCALKPYVNIYIPQNEPNGAVQLGYLAGHWPPGILLNPWLYKRAMKSAVDNFRTAVSIVKEEDPKAIIMSVHSLPYWRKSFWKDPTRATYHTMMRQNFDHLDQVHDLVDIVGINYYYSQDADLPDFFYQGRGEESPEYTQMGWKIDPEGLYEVIKQIERRYHKPMVIVENGIGTKNEQKKIKYLRDHITQIRRALADGLDVRGYFAWTLVDNYEWTEGYRPNFGLTIFDPKTKKRILEPSAKFYAGLIQAYGNLRRENLEICEED